MTFRPAGLLVLALLVLLAVIGGAARAVAVLRIALALVVIAAFVEVVVNMFRHRDGHVRGRLLGMLLQFRR